MACDVLCIKVREGLWQPRRLCLPPRNGPRVKCATGPLPHQAGPPRCNFGVDPADAENRWGMLGGVGNSEVKQRKNDETGPGC